MNYMSKSVKLAISYSLIVIGIAGMCGSGYIYLKPLKDEDTAKTKKNLISECKSSSKRYGHTVVQIGDSIDFISNGVSDWSERLSSMSLIALQCKGFKIEEFCMGTECKDSRNKDFSGIYMQLKYNQ